MFNLHELQYELVYLNENIHFVKNFLKVTDSKDIKVVVNNKQLLFQ